jgi:hypothetical protein
MKAIRVNKFGGPEVLQLEDVPDLIAGPGKSWYKFERLASIRLTPTSDRDFTR